MHPHELDVMIRTQRHIAQTVALVSTAVFLGVMTAAQGGYFPASWGWSSLSALLVVGLWVVAAQRSEITRIEVVELGLLVLLFLWTLLSAAWSGDVGTTIQEAQRTLVALAVVSALLIVLRQRAAPAVLGGVLVAISGVCAYAVATRILPRHFGSFTSADAYRLSAPIGYWNGLGLFAAMGVLLALGIVASEWSLRVRAASALTIPLNLVTLYFSFSRGGWLALAVGVAVSALSTRAIGRLALAWLVTAPFAAATVWYAMALPALTHRHATLGSAASEGRRLAAVLLLACGASALGLALLAYAARRGFPLERVGRVVAIAATSIVVLAGIAWLASNPGRPGTFAAHARHAFADEESATPRDLNHRLFTLSSSGRVRLWGVAWRDFRSHPMIGSGAGTFEREWLADRSLSFYARDAHSLYLETLAELGLPGFLLVAGVLLIPLGVALSRRGSPIGAIGAGAYAAFLVHAAGDWDWELSGISCAALAIGSAVLIGTRKPEREAIPVRPFIRAGMAAAVAPLVVFAAVGWLGNAAAASAQTSLDHKHWGRAAQEARRAARLMPWSSEPYLLSGRAFLGSGDRADARAEFRSAIRRSPNDWQAWLNLAVASSGNARTRAWMHAKRLYPNGQQVALAKIEFAQQANAKNGSR